MSKFSIVIALVLLLITLCVWLRPFRELFEPIPAMDLKVDAHKKTHEALLIHYGTLQVDIKVFSDSIRTYAKDNQLDYFNCPESNPWQAVYFFFQKHQYEYIMILPTNVYLKTKTRHWTTLVRQAGDVELILCRDERNLKTVNLDVVILHHSEWTLYKLHQLYHKSKEDAAIPLDVILDQVYTTYVHHTFEECDEYISQGVPYMLSNICVYNEHALVSSQSDFLRYYDRMSTTKEQTNVVYPWKSVTHPQFISLTATPTTSIEVPALVDTRIPKIIFQTMESHLTMHNIRSCIQQVKTLNPGYKHYYFNSYDARQFIRAHMPEVLEFYDALIPGAYKADLWRYCVLYHYGGFYLDTRMFPYLSFDSVISKSTEFLSCVDVSESMLYQAILGAAPKSKYMRYAIDECVLNIKKRILSNTDLGVTGPRVMGNALNRALKREPGSSLRDVMDPRVVLLQWNSLKAPKYLQDAQNIFACHKYTKLMTEAEVHKETTLWLMLTGKEHYSGAYQANRVYKEPLLTPPSTDAATDSVAVAKVG